MEWQAPVLIQSARMVAPGGVAPLTYNFPHRWRPPFTYHEESLQRYNEFWEKMRNDPDIDMGDTRKIQEEYEKWFQNLVNELVAKDPQPDICTALQNNEPVLVEEQPNDDSDSDDSDTSIDSSIREARDLSRESSC